MQDMDYGGKNPLEKYHDDASPPVADARSKTIFHRIFDTLKGTAQIFINADGIRAGAATAFYGAFSLAPLLVILTGVIAWIWDDQTAQKAILDSLRSLIGVREADTLADLLAHTSSETSDKGALLGSIFAALTTILGASGVFGELRGALQTMFEQTPQKFHWFSLVRVRLAAVGIIIGSAFLAAVAMVVQTMAVGFVHWVSLAWPGVAGIVKAFEIVWSWLAIVAVFAMIMRWLPDTHLPWRPTLAGALLAATLFMVGRLAISYYIANTVIQSPIGAASSFVALLVWIYWSSVIFLLGGAFAGQLAKERLKGEAKKQIAY